MKPEYRDKTFIETRTHPILAMVYGYLQPQNGRFVQLSYIPQSIASRRDINRLSPSDVQAIETTKRNTPFYKWVMLVDRIGRDSYVDMTSNLQTPDISHSPVVWSPQLVEIPLERIRQHYPNYSLQDFEHVKEIHRILMRVCDEFSLDPNKISIGGSQTLEGLDALQHPTDFYHKWLTSDVDFIIHDKQDSQRIRDRLTLLRRDHPERFYWRRGTTGDLIPHRYSGRYPHLPIPEVCVDWHFSYGDNDSKPNIDPIDVKLLKPNVTVSNIEIVDVSDGPFIPQRFKTNPITLDIHGQPLQLDQIISYAHRYDFLQPEKRVTARGSVAAIKEKGVETFALLVNEYGGIQSRQTRGLKA